MKMCLVQPQECQQFALTSKHVLVVTWITTSVLDYSLHALPTCTCSLRELRWFETKLATTVCEYLVSKKLTKFCNSNEIPVPYNVWAIIGLHCVQRFCVFQPLRLIKFDIKVAFWLELLWLLTVRCASCVVCKLFIFSTSSQKHMAGF